MSRSGWIGAGLLLIAALLQGSVLPFVTGGRVPLNLVLVLVIVWALIRGPQPALIWAVAGGLWLDLLSGVPLGTAMLALILVAYACTIGVIPWLSATGLVAAVVTAGGTLLYTFLYLFLLRTRQLPGVESWWAIWHSSALPAMLVNALVAIPAFWLLARFAGRTPLRRSAP
ncbi:MAG: rod shape-determining protein MreD [Dehalococcoidia bacterium]|nr:rod shape-determining protein MreD [Dehalococcoidia bacterium]